MRWPACAVLLVCGLLSSHARADLSSDVKQLSAEWRSYSRVQHLKPQLFERGDLRPVLLPEGADNPRQAGCTSVAVIGSVSQDFVLRFVPVAGEPRWENGEWPEKSVAGAAQVVRCGERKAMLSRLVVEMRSPRGVLEFLVAEAKAPVPALQRLLSSRDPGPVGDPAVTGPRPAPAPVDERGKAIEEQNKLRAASSLGRSALQVGPEGNAQVLLRIEPGCHRLDLLGEATGAGARGVDIDAELSWAPAGDHLAGDRTESADASLEFCSGDSGVALLRFAGAEPESQVLMLRARWNLPAGLPARWGPDARGRMAEALRANERRLVAREPIYETLGVAGNTRLGLEVEAGHCYLVAVSGIRGEQARISLSASAGRQTSNNRSVGDASGTSLGICNPDAERALLQVDARGANVAWILAVWQVGRVPIGEVAE